MKTKSIFGIDLALEKALIIAENSLLKIWKQSEKKLHHFLDTSKKKQKTKIKQTKKERLKVIEKITEEREVYSEIFKSRNASKKEKRLFELKNNTHQKEINSEQER